MSKDPLKYYTDPKTRETFRSVSVDRRRQTNWSFQFHDWVERCGPCPTCGGKSDV